MSRDINLEYEALMLAEDVQPWIEALYKYYQGAPGYYDLGKFVAAKGAAHTEFVKKKYGVWNMSDFEIYVRERLWNIEI